MLYYTRNSLLAVMSSIDFLIKDGYPPIDVLKGYMWLPEHLMQRHESCYCVQWV